MTAHLIAKSVIPTKLVTNANLAISSKTENVCPTVRMATLLTTENAKNASMQIARAAMDWLWIGAQNVLLT
jgi:hypothetical protein